MSGAGALLSTRQHRHQRRRTGRDRKPRQSHAADEGLARRRQPLGVLRREVDHQTHPATGS